MYQSGMAALIIVLCLSAAPALAEDCPAKSTAPDDVVAALNETPNCDAAMKMFKACEYGASGDTELGEVVEKKCEADFLSQLKTSQKRIYYRDMRSCDRKYRKRAGTMYISFTAFCRAEIAQRYSRRALKANAPTVPR
jgi:hypothetical protein